MGKPRLSKPGPIGLSSLRHSRNLSVNSLSVISNRSTHRSGNNVPRMRQRRNRLLSPSASKKEMSSRRIRSALNSPCRNPSKGGMVSKTHRNPRQTSNPARKSTGNSRLARPKQRGSLEDLSHPSNLKVCRSKADNSNAGNLSLNRLANHRPCPNARRNRHAHGSNRKDG